MIINKYKTPPLTPHLERVEMSSDMNIGYYKQSLKEVSDSTEISTIKEEEEQIVEINKYLVEHKISNPLYLNIIEVK